MSNSTKEKFKRFGEKIAGAVLIAVGFITTYHGIKLCTKKRYIKADIPEREYTTIN